jgi:hypothetical protein
MSQTSIFRAFEDHQVPAAPASQAYPMVEGQGRHDPASQAVTRAVLLRCMPWFLPLLCMVLVVAAFRA